MNLKTLVRSAILVALTLGFQSLALPQPITGPVVNAILLVATAIVGPIAGVLIGAITPWVALLTGTMPVPFVMPVIMAGNLALVLGFALLKKTNRYIAAGVACVAKWLAMSAGIQYLLSSGKKLPAPLIAALTMTQLMTAAAGAAVALIVIQALEVIQKRSDDKPEKPEAARRLTVKRTSAGQ